MPEQVDEVAAAVLHDRPQPFLVSSVQEFAQVAWVAAVNGLRADVEIAQEDHCTICCQASLHTQLQGLHSATKFCGVVVHEKAILSQYRCKSQDEC